MTATQENISVLDKNKTVVFYSPLDSNDVLVRTGTMEASNSILHAISHAYSRDYVKMSSQDRKLFVKKLKNNLQNSESSTVQDSKKTLKIAFDFWDNIPKNKKCELRETRKLVGTVINSETDEEVFKIICEIINKKDLENIFKNLNKSLEISELSLNKSLNSLGDIDSKYKTFCLSKMKLFVQNILKESFRNKTPKKVFLEKVEEKHLNILQLSLDRDIYIFDSIKRIPNYKTNPRNKKSILLLRLKNDHYEVIGRLLAGDKVQREFAPDDPLIKRIQSLSNSKLKSKSSSSKSSSKSSSFSSKSSSKSSSSSSKSSSSSSKSSSKSN
jgi:hypothetical protein